MPGAYFGVALHALKSNPLRSLLTTLGVVVGVAAVVAVSLILQGMSRAITRSFEGMGPRSLFIVPAQASENRSRSVELTYEDAEAIRRACEAVTLVAPQITLTATLISSGAPRPVNLTATIPEYQDMNGVYVEEGRFFSHTDIERRRPVCVIGRTARNTIKQSNPVGALIRLDRHYFKVIGVMEPRGTLMGADRDDVALIPLSTATRLYGSQLPKKLTIMAQARDVERIDDAIEQISGVLRQRHRLGAGPADFRIFTQTEILNSVRRFSTMITGVVAGIVGIALFVGGIGIMNTMLASVAERAYEIGIRKSVGARRSAILSQFLIESVTLGAGGGVIGIVVGCMAGLGIGLVTGIPMAPTLWPPVLSFGFACLVGLFFGVYPAARAADMDPIRAIQRV